MAIEISPSPILGFGLECLFLFVGLRSFVASDRLRYELVDSRDSLLSLFLLQSLTDCEHLFGVIGCDLFLLDPKPQTSADTDGQRRYKEMANETH